jgi:hypothetical protein
MPCDVKFNFKTALQISLEINLVTNMSRAGREPLHRRRTLYLNSYLDSLYDGYSEPLLGLWLDAPPALYNIISRFSGKNSSRTSIIETFYLLRYRLGTSDFDAQMSGIKI